MARFKWRTSSPRKDDGFAIGTQVIGTKGKHKDWVGIVQHVTDFTVNVKWNIDGSVEKKYKTTLEVCSISSEEEEDDDSSTETRTSDQVYIRWMLDMHTQLMITTMKQYGMDVNKAEQHLLMAFETFKNTTTKEVKDSSTYGGFFKDATHM